MISSAAMPGKPKVRKRAIPILKLVSTAGASGSGSATAAVTKADEEDVMVDRRDAKRARKEKEAADPDATQEIVRPPHIPDFALASVLPVGVIRNLIYSYADKLWHIQDLPTMRADRLAFAGPQRLAVADIEVIEAFDAAGAPANVNNSKLELYSVDEHGVVNVNPVKQQTLVVERVDALQHVPSAANQGKLVLGAAVAQVFDANTLGMEKIRQLEAQTGQLHCFDGGSKVVWVGADKFVKLYDEKQAAENQRVRQISSKPCISIAMLPNNQLAVGSEDLIRIFDLSPAAVAANKPFGYNKIDLKEAGFYKRHAHDSQKVARTLPTYLAPMHGDTPKLLVGRGVEKNILSVGVLDVQTGKFETMRYLNDPAQMHGSTAAHAVRPIDGETVAVLANDTSVHVWNPVADTLTMVEGANQAIRGIRQGDLAASNTRHGVPMVAWTIKDDYSDDAVTSVAVQNRPAPVEEWMRAQDVKRLALNRTASLLLKQQRASASAAGSAAAAGVSPQLAQKPGSLGSLRLSDLA